MATRASYWNLKNEDLIKLLVERDIGFDPDNLDRKAAVEQLVRTDAEGGNLEEPVQVTDEGLAGPVKVKRKYVDIVFHNQEGFPKYVFLGYNGQTLYLPRECVCRIPEEFLDVVKHAVSKSLVQYTVDGQLVYKEVKIPRFSYEVLERGEI